MSILSKVKKLIGKNVYIEPIVDYNRYSDSEKSYAGGSLADSNVLIVTNTELTAEIKEQFTINEKASIAILPPKGLLNQDAIISAGNNLIGPFTHIINIYKKETSELLTADRKYPETDEMYRVYQWLQEEVSYLVPLNQYASICTAYIGDETQYSDVLCKNMDMCIRGLGEVMGNHTIINNGIVASSSVPMQEIINSSIYLSSKYGQIMTGEVLHLK